jgi:hypothetical protein
MKPTRDNLVLHCPYDGSVERAKCDHHFDCGFGDCAYVLCAPTTECQCEEALNELIVEINKTIKDK